MQTDTKNIDNSHSYSKAQSDLGTGILSSFEMAFEMKSAVLLMNAGSFPAIGNSFLVF